VDLELTRLGFQRVRFGIFTEGLEADVAEVIVFAARNLADARRLEVFVRLERLTGANERLIFGAVRFHNRRALDLIATLLFNRERHHDRRIKPKALGQLCGNPDVVLALEQRRRDLAEEQESLAIAVDELAVTL